MGSASGSVAASSASAAATTGAAAAQRDYIGMAAAGMAGVAGIGAALL